MKNYAKIILSVIGVILLAGLGTVLVLSQRIVMNPDGTVGNTAGNLNNEGLFCEYDGTVYFYNSFDGGGLFAMNPDESNLRRINNMVVRNILAGGKYLYYFPQQVEGSQRLPSGRPWESSPSSAANWMAVMRNP